ncbi:MAG: phosphotransferase [Pseudomonadota bacterium]
MPDLSTLAARWGRVDEPPTLVAARENHVYRCQIEGQAVALRLHRAAYQSKAAIESELRWMARIAEVGFPCPRPVPSSAGAVLETLETGQHASAISWLDGEAIGDGDTALTGSEQEITALFAAVGALIAAFHDATDAIDTTDLMRPAWDADALVGDAPLWGKFWENPTLSKAEANLLIEAKARAYETLMTMDTVDAGLIHADCLQENILSTPAGLALIDFDDAGLGYRGYDLGTALVQHYAHPRLSLLGDALLAGYGTLRTPPSPDDLRFFTMLRAMASCGWVITRGAGNLAYQRAQADRAMACVHAWLE